MVSEVLENDLKIFFKFRDNNYVRVQLETGDTPVNNDERASPDMLAPSSFGVVQNPTYAENVRTNSKHDPP